MINVLKNENFELFDAMNDGEAGVQNWGRFEEAEHVHDGELQTSRGTIGNEEGKTS